MVEQNILMELARVRYFNLRIIIFKIRIITVIIYFNKICHMSKCSEYIFLYKYIYIYINLECLFIQILKRLFLFLMFLL